jgi:predicted AAA+ superfamily ATPase
METYIPRFFKEPGQSFFLFGPRGTGKSTFLKHQYADALWIDLLKPDIFRTYAARPERIIELVHGNPDKQIVIVDEVQKVPEILSAVHSLIEEKVNKRFILTGSSARKLKRTGIDLLAGRVLLRTLHPFMMSELTMESSFENSNSELLTSRRLKSHHFIDKFQIGVGINGFSVIQNFAQFRNSPIGPRCRKRVQSHR